MQLHGAGRGVDCQGVDVRTLPWDYYRCKPAEPTGRCEQCLRWKELPGQDWGPRTPLVTLYQPEDQGCDFIPLYPVETEKK